MTETIITLVLPMAFAAAALWGSVFYEKDGWRSWGRFAVLLLGSAGLALTVNHLMPLLGRSCSAEAMEASVWKYVLMLCYVGVLGMIVLAAFYMVVAEGLLDAVSGWLSGSGCIVSGLILLAPAWRVGVFVVKNFWWLGLAVLVMLALIGLIVGGAGSVSASGQSEDIFVDKYGNEYISTSSQNAYDGQWNVTKTYRIKGQNGRKFYRKLR